MSTRTALVLALGVGFTAGGIVRGDVVSVTSSGDTTLYSESGSLSNGAGAHVYAGFTAGGSERRGLLRFDLAVAIPAHSTINSASLTLTLSTTTTATSSVSLHRALAGWGEGSSNAGEPGGQGVAATAGDATWTASVFPATPWATPGGDFSPSPSATLAVPGTLGTYSWTSATMATDVQSWLDSPADNHGWEIVVGVGTRNAKRFDSREHPDRDARPALVIDFTPPCPADLDDGTGTGTPDGGVDINDLLYFLAQHEAGANAADLDDGTGTGTPDGGVDINDLLFFLAHYEAGC